MTLDEARAILEMAAHDPVKLKRTGEWLYHVTYYARLQSILRAGGLAPGHSVGSTFGSQYAGHARGKLFVSRGQSRPHYWYSRLSDWSEHSGPEFPDLENEDEDRAEEWVAANSEFTAVVLRYRDHGRHPWSPDYQEDIEHDDDLYWTSRRQRVPAKLLSVWDPEDGQWWSRLDRGTIDDLGESLSNLADESLASDPSGFSYDYAPNSSKLLRAL